MKRREERDKLMNYHRSLSSELHTLFRISKSKKVKKGKDKKLKDEIKTLLKNIKVRMNEVLLDIHGGDYTALREEEKKDQVLFNCPVGDCRGFVSSAEHKCGLCGTRVCKKCNVIITEEDSHKCKEEDIETVKILHRETKPCPECHAIIYKTEGCDQMWCTQCKTPFSWRTGQKVFERIHNPHYYEWQRQQNGGVAPRVEGDVVGNAQGGGCGGLVELYAVMRALPKKRSGDYTHGAGSIISFHRFGGHLLDMFQQPTAIDNIDLRISYLQGELTQEKFSWLLQRRQKKYEKDLELNQLVQMFQQVSDEQVFRTVIVAANQGVEPPQLVDDAKKKIKEICNFFNEQMKIIADKYNNQMYQIVIEKISIIPDDVYWFKCISSKNLIITPFGL